MSLSKLVASVAAIVLFLAAQPVSSSSALDLPTLEQKLVPIRLARTESDRARRDLVDSEVLLPKRNVVFEYGSDDKLSTSIATISFDSSRTYPILAVEAFDDLLSTIQCDTIGRMETGITMTFVSEQAATVASETWNSYHCFHIVTSHVGCNLEDEHGAWRVHAMVASPTSSIIKLFAERISMNQLGSYDISVVGHELSGVWRPQVHHARLDRRIIFEPSMSKNLSGTELISIDTSTLPDDLASKVADSKLDIQCADCIFNFNFTVDLNVSVSDLLNLTAMSVSTTVNNFDQSALLGVSVGAGPLTFSHSLDVFNLPLSPLQIRDLFNFGPEVGVTADFDLDISGAVQFTVGAKASIDPGAFASFDFLTKTESDKGWDSAKIQPIPMKVQGGQLNATLTASISPFIGIGITLPLNTGEPIVEVRVSQNAPAVVLASSLTTNVNRQCQPIGANDFESFDTAYQISADLQFETHVGLVGNLAKFLPDWDEVFQHGDIPLLNNTESSSNKTCFVIVDDSPTNSSAMTNGAEVAIQTTAPTGTLMEAASAVPTFDVPKIVSYFSANNGQLPTNVNYQQLAQVTTLPDSIKTPVQKAVQSQIKNSSSAVGMGSSISYYYLLVTYSLVVFAGIFMM